MPYVSRQIIAGLSQGIVQADGQFKKIWDFQDVLWRTKLIIASGKSTGGKLSLGAGVSYRLQLPVNYVNTNYLFVMISAYGLIRVDQTPVGSATQRMLLKGTTTTEAMTCFNDTITSIDIINPSGTDAVFVEYSLVELPDLTLPANYREGTIVRGTV